jgi:hypothetical protein
VSKIGVNLKIDVTKIDKSKIFNANSGAKYLDMTVFIDPNTEDSYGNHGMITQSLTKEERNANVKSAILGNAKVFWREDPTEVPQPNVALSQENLDVDIPF